MTTTAPGVAHDTPAGDLSANRASFLRALWAANLSPLTLRTYADAVDRLADYLAAHAHGSRCLVTTLVTGPSPQPCRTPPPCLLVGDLPGRVLVARPAGSWRNVARGASQDP